MSTATQNDSAHQLLDQLKQQIGYERPFTFPEALALGQGVDLDRDGTLATLKALRQDGDLSKGGGGLLRVVRPTPVTAVTPTTTTETPVATPETVMPTETSTVSFFEGETPKQRGRSFIQRWRMALAKSDMDRTAKHVGQTLSLFAGEDGEAWPSVTELAQLTSISGREYVTKALRRLEAAGWLRIEWSKGGTKVDTHRFEFIITHPPR